MERTLRVGMSSVYPHGSQNRSLRRRINWTFIVWYLLIVLSGAATGCWGGVLFVRYAFHAIAKFLAR